MDKGLKKKTKSYQSYMLTDQLICHLIIVRYRRRYNIVLRHNK